MRKKVLIIAIVAFALILTLCTALFPAVEIKAADNTEAVCADAHLRRPVVSKLKNTYRGIAVSWTPVSGAGSYYVYRKESSESEWKRIAITEDISYMDEEADAFAGISFDYKVRAVSAGSTDPGKESIVSRPETIVRLGKPAYKRFKMQNIRRGIRIVYLRELNGADGMIVFRKAEGESSFKRIAKVKGRSYFDKDVVSGTNYIYKFCFYKDGSKGSVSKEVSLRRLNRIFNIRCDDHADGYELSWKPVPYADGYQIFWYEKTANNGRGAYEFYAETTKTEYYDRDHEPLSESFNIVNYKVRAYYYEDGKKKYGAFGITGENFDY